MVFVNTAAAADEIAREGDGLAADLRAWAARRIRGGGDKRGAGAPAADAPASKRRRPPPKAADLCDAAQVKVVIENEDLYWGHPSDDDAPGSRHYTTARRSSRLQPAAAAPAEGELDLAIQELPGAVGDDANPWSKAEVKTGEFLSELEFRYNTFLKDWAEFRKKLLED